MIALSLLTLGLSLQDPVPARIVLEDLAGGRRERSSTSEPLLDPRKEGAIFARYRDAGEPGPLPGDPGDRGVVHLHGGDRIWAQVEGGSEEMLQLAMHGGASLELFVDEMAILLFPGRLPSDGSAEPQPADEGDRLYVQRGRGLDKLDGLVTGFSEEGVAFEGRFGERTYAWREVAALFIEDLGEGGEATEEAVPVAVDLPDGGRLSGDLVMMDGAGVTLARGNRQVFLPAGVVGELAVVDGSYVFLSQLEVADAGPITLFGGDDDLGMVYPHRIDRNCMNGPLRSGGRSWSRGLGVHAPSRLTWSLEGGWEELRAVVAVDDSVLRSEMHGSVRFRVLVDGELRWESFVMEGGNAPVAIPAIGLEGARELILEVDPATEAFVSDRANWLRPILVRS